MKWAGIILANNAALGETLKTELGLTSWLVTTPERLAQGGCRGVTAAPRLLILSSTEPYGVRDELLACFAEAPESPAMYWLTGGAL